MKNKILKLVAVVFVICSVLSVSVSADTTKSYTYWLGNGDKTLTYSKPIYDYYTTVTGGTLGYNNFNKPSDIFCADNNEIYILEEGNSRISVIDGNGALKRTVTAFYSGNGEKYEFAGAKGLYVTKNGDVYIADTLNARILKGNKDGKLISEFLLPESSLIPEDFIYTPTKVAVDKKGYIYVVSSGSTYGALLFDSSGNFTGFYGSNTVNAGVSTFFKTLWNKFFASEAQLSGQVQKVPYQFTDICLDDNDFAYTVTGTTNLDETEQTGQIRCLNPKSKNVLTVKNSEKYENTDSFNFGDDEVVSKSQGTGYRLQNFSSVAVDNYGNIFALDNTYGRIYVYDRECNLLCAFAGGMGEGTENGTFVNPTDIAVSGDMVYVSDETLNTVTVFKLNSYGELLRKADSMYLNGNYDEAKDYWLEINKTDPNCQVAYHGLAKAYLIEKDYEKALYYAKEGRDYASYNQAFTYERTKILKSAFLPFLAILIVLIAIVVILSILKKRGKLSFKLNKRLRIMLSSPIHPFELARSVKQKEGSYILATAVLVLFYIFKVADETMGGFLFSKFDAHSYNALFTFLSTIILVLLWTVCYWAMSVLLSGKCKLGEVYIISSYAMIPQIINCIFHLAMSNILVSEESAVLGGFSMIMFILSAVILCIGCMGISEFGFFTFLGVAILAVAAMVVIVFVIFMVLTLDQQLIAFIQSIYKEVMYR